jgi:hypothetical protein
VARERLRGLGEREVEVLGDPDHAVEEAARKCDVVIDDEHPVGSPIRSVNGV